MKKYAFIFLISTQIFSQTASFKGKLLDKETKQPVVYANISFLNSNKGISSTEEGFFSMNLNEKDLDSKVHISCLNYKDTIVFAKQLNNKTFYLVPKTVLLDEITISKKTEKTVVLGEVKKDVYGVHTVGLRMLAKYFPNDKRIQCCTNLESIKIHFSKRKNQQKKAKFRIRIFSKDETTGLPKDDLLNINLPIEIKDGEQLVTVDISNYNLEMPKNGVFIAFEKLFIPFNEYGKNEKDSENEFYYAPIIGYVKYAKKNRNDNFYFYVKGQWQQSPLTKTKFMNTYAPAIALKLTN